MTLRVTWAAWYSRDHKPYALPRHGQGSEELVQVLMCIHRSFHKDGLNRGYVGGLVSEAIRAWKPPSTQRRISKSALQHLEGGGERNALKKEHDPPVAFYRDQILHNEFLTADHMRQFVEGMKLTLVTKDEDAVLTKSIEERRPWKLIRPKSIKECRSWKSIRPPDAYDLCVPPIAPVAYPKEEGCAEHLRAKLYPKTRAIKTPGE
jgi:hypothetical protein